MTKQQPLDNEMYSFCKTFKEVLQTISNMKKPQAPITNWSYIDQLDRMIDNIEKTKLVQAT